MSELDLVVSEVLLGADPHLILPTIKRRMKQFNLTSQYQAHEIFTEAYLRMSRRIEAGVLIANLPASFKITILHITQEYSKRQISQRNLEKKLDTITDTFEEISVCDGTIESNLLRLRAALKTMRPQELLILRLRIVEDWSWSEIGDYLVECGEEENTPQLRATLRQRGRRILERLRQNYFSA